LEILMTSSTTDTQPVALRPELFSTQEELALTGFLTGYSGLTREAYMLDLRQSTATGSDHERSAVATHPREISSRSANDNRNDDTLRSGGAGRCNDFTARAIAHREPLTSSHNRQNGAKSIKAGVLLSSPEPTSALERYRCRRRGRSCVPKLRRRARRRRVCSASRAPPR
jgi:hypothetical protein